MERRPRRGQVTPTVRRIPIALPEDGNRPPAGAAIALLASIDLTDSVSNVIAFNPYDYPSGLERGNWFARVIGTGVRLPGSGPIFARLENRLILKGVLAGGFADRGALPKDFLVELRRSGRRHGY